MYYVYDICIFTIIVYEYIYIYIYIYITQDNYSLKMDSVRGTHKAFSFG